MMGIYAYFDKKDNSVVYVGKDSNIDKGKRRRDHIQPSNYNKQPFNRVLQNNLNRYEYKEIFVFDEISQTELNQLEMQQIALFNPKFNFTKGGEGMLGYKHSLESRRKMSEACKGRKIGPLSEEHRRKISESNKGKKHSKEARRKMSEYWTGRKRGPMSDETRKKISKANKGRTISEEWRKKISEGHKGSIPWNKGKTNVYSEETRKKMSESHKGKKASDETKKKMSMARTKKYPRINKGGFQNGKRVYKLYFEGKTLKSSICREKLEIELNKMLEELE